MASIGQRIRQSFGKGKKKKHKDREQPCQQNHTSVEVPSVTLKVHKEDIKREITALIEAAKLVNKKVGKLKKKGQSPSDIDFRDDFNQLQSRFEAVKRCFHCDDGEDLQDEAYGFERNTRMPASGQHSTEVTVHSQNNEPYNPRFGGRDNFKRSQSVNENKRPTRAEQVIFEAKKTKLIKMMCHIHLMVLKEVNKCLDTFSIDRMEAELKVREDTCAKKYITDNNMQLWQRSACDIKFYGTFKRAIYRGAWPRLSADFKSCKDDLKQCRSDLQKEVAAREEAQNRLSEMMGKQLKTNNPAITDLSDPSRPLNLVEKFSNLYDNEWTDAIEDVESITKDEWLASKILLTVVTDSYKECYNLRHKGRAFIGFENRYSCIKHEIKNVPDELGPQLKKLHEKELNKLRQAVLDKQDHEHRVERNVLTCLSNKKQYMLKCVEICWMMVCHSPPVHLEWNYTGQEFDHQLIKPFTEDGTKVEFVVWPVMFLHKNGPLLCKGVAQGTTGKQQTHF